MVCSRSDTTNPVRTSEHRWYVWFWVGMGLVLISPIYVLLFLIWRKD